MDDWVCKWVSTKLTNCVFYALRMQAEWCTSLVYGVCACERMFVSSLLVPTYHNALHKRVVVVFLVVFVCVCVSAWVCNVSFMFIHTDSRAPYRPCVTYILSWWHKEQRTQKIIFSEATESQRNRIIISLSWNVKR